VNTPRILAGLLVVVPALALAQPPDPQQPPQPQPQPPQPQPPPPEEPPPPPHNVEPPPPPRRPQAQPPVVVVATPKPEPVLHARWDATLYGFVEADSLYDTTQSLIDVQGNAALLRPGSYKGDHGQTTFGVRNSRIGFKLAAPDYNSVRATAQLEMDFQGNQPGRPYDSTNLVSEQQFWQNPGFRVRLMNLRLDTPAFDFLFGQMWQLFGWQSLFHPNTVEIQGVPGEIYSRSPQIRISKLIHAGNFGVEIAIAASRPPQRASATPDGQVGLKLSYNGIRALHTNGATGTGLDGLTLAASAVGRRFAVDELSAMPASQVVRKGYGVSIDGLIPVVPARSRTSTALTVQANYTVGAGIADLYQGLTGGVTNPTLPNPMMLPTPPTYVPNIDPGLVMFYATDSTLHPVQWESLLGGFQLYLPPSAKWWISGNYSHLHSQNAHYFGAPGSVWDTQDWADANLMFDVTPAVRLGFEGSYTDQTYVDGVHAKNYRGQFSAFFIF
jgi:hypothetical protein